VSAQALAARVSAGAERTADLRDRVAASTLPPVERALLLGVVADSHDYFRRQVAMSWVPDYLSERCLGDAIHTHQLGHAPKGWTSLTDHLRSLGYTDYHIEASGMAARARNGHLIDRFRDRLTAEGQARLCAAFDLERPYRGAPPLLGRDLKVEAPPMDDQAVVRPSGAASAR
jgi:hypothetical protein